MQRAFMCSTKFAEAAQGLNVKVRIVAAHAHWQMGKTERHGEILQEMLRKYDHEYPIENSMQFMVALTLCCNAKDAIARHKGFTPEILVLGKSRVLPGNITQDGQDPAQYLAIFSQPAAEQH